MIPRARAGDSNSSSDSARGKAPSANSRMIIGRLRRKSAASRAMPRPLTTISCTVRPPGICVRPPDSTFASSAARWPSACNERQIPMAGGTLNPMTMPAMIRPDSEDEIGNHLPTMSGAEYIRPAPTALRTPMMQALIRMIRPALPNWSPAAPRRVNADQKKSTASWIASMKRRSAPGARPPIHRHIGAAERLVRGARTDVMAVVMESTGPNAEPPATSEGLRRPMASENSPIWGIVMPTRAASSALRPASIEPMVFATILPTMNTPTTTSPGSR